MSLGAWIAFLAAAGVGATARLLLDGWVGSRVRSDLPWGTFVVNVLGSLLLGVLTGLATGGAVGEPAETVLASGALGAFTTFSTFGVQSAALIGEGRWAGAAGNLLANLLVGLAAVAAGMLLVGIA